MAKFKVGEIAVTVNCTHLNAEGKEAEIVALLGNGMYRVKSEALNETTLSYERNLRKKKPPEEKTTWKEVYEITGWNPQRASKNLTVKRGI